MDGIIQGFKEKINLLLGDGRTFVSLVLILVALTAFGLGRQSVKVPDQAAASLKAIPATPTPKEPATEPKSVTTEPKAAATTVYVASKNGTVYHLPHCSGAKRIKEENKVTFNTKEEAETAGYRPAANCKGI